MGQEGRKDLSFYCKVYIFIINKFNVRSTLSTNVNVHSEVLLTLRTKLYSRFLDINHLA